MNSIIPSDSMLRNARIRMLPLLITKSLNGIKFSSPLEPASTTVVVPRVRQYSSGSMLRRRTSRATWA